MMTFERIPQSTGIVPPYKPLPDNKRDQATMPLVPYWISAELSDPKLMPFDTDKFGQSFLNYFWPVLGTLMHITTWCVVLWYDTIVLLRDTFNDPGSMARLLQIAATTTLWIAAGVVLFITLAHFGVLAFNFFRRGREGRTMYALKWSFVSELLPAVISSAILTSINASYEFSKFLLFFVIFQPIVEVQGTSAVDYKVKEQLIIVIVLKLFGMSLTRNQHRVKVFDLQVAAQ